MLQRQGERDGHPRMVAAGNRLAERITTSPSRRALSGGRSWGSVMRSQWKGLVLGLSAVAFSSVMILSGLWSIGSFIWALQAHGDLDNSTAILAQVQSIRQLEVMRRKVRTIEEFADISWRDARGGARQARISLDRHQLVVRDGRQYLRIRYFENDPSRQPKMMIDQMAASIIDSDENSLYSGLLVFTVGAVGFLIVFSTIRSYPPVRKLPTSQG